MAPMEAQPAISWGDPRNFCTVSKAELCGEELLLFLTADGAQYPPEDAEVATPGPKPLRLFGRKGSTARRSQENRRQVGDQRSEVTLAFDCPPELQSAEDVFFSYAPGYSCASILDLILSSIVQPRTMPRSPLTTSNDLDLEAYLPTASDWPSKPSTSAESCSAKSSASKPRLEAWTVAQEPSTSPGSPSSNPNDSSPDAPEPPVAKFSNLPVLRPLQTQQDGHRKQPQGLSKQEEPATCGREAFVENQRSSPSSCSTAAAAAELASSSGCEAFFHAAEAGHERTTLMLKRRLAELQTLHRAWQSGDSRALVEALELSRDDAVLYEALQRLEQCTKPWPPQVLARLLPLSQRLSNSSSEAHAVVAMRFAIKAIEVSWPPIVRALQNVATPKATSDDCKGAVQSVSAFFQVVKVMSRSVRLSRRSNGSLVPVCKELKTSLERALGATGRVRGTR